MGITFRASARSATGARIAATRGVTARCAILAGLFLGLLGCHEVGDHIIPPGVFAAPPSAVLGSPSAAAPPVDPRFVDAEVAYAAEVRTLHDLRGAEADVHARVALRRLADAIALVPGRPSEREEVFVAANDLRATALRMATTYENDPRAQIAEARRALTSAALALVRVATTAYAGAPDALAGARAFEAATRAIDPARPEPDRQGVARALAAADHALGAFLRAALASAPRASG